MRLTQGAVPVEADGVTYCACAQPRCGGKKRHIRGPCRPDQQAAQEDLETMRAAASGMGREEGFAAMAAEAKRLSDGKMPKEAGSVEPFGKGFRARIPVCPLCSRRGARGIRSPHQSLA